MLWRVRGSIVSWAKLFVGFPSCYLVSPRPAVPLCAAPIRRAREMFEFWIRQMKIHEATVFTSDEIQVLELGWETTPVFISVLL